MNRGDYKAGYGGVALRALLLLTALILALCIVGRSITSPLIDAVASTLVCGAVALYVGAACGKRGEGRGITTGLISGGAVILVMLLMAMIMFGKLPGKAALFRICLSTLIPGAIGGIIGASIRPRRRRK